MKLSNLNLNGLLFSLLLVVAFVFIGASVWLTGTVNQRRTQLDNLVGQISLISTFESDLMDCFNQSESNDEVAFEINFNKVLNTDFELEKYPELKELSVKTAALEEFLGFAGGMVGFAPFQNRVERLYTISSDQKQNNREELKSVSNKLAGQWKYIIVLVVLACMLVVTLAVAGLVVFRSRKKLNYLKIKNSLFMDSVVDCVIVCDNDGKIVEINAPASKTFGYKEEEAKGMSIKDFYASDTDRKCVQEQLIQNHFFKGEIVNKKRNGNHFVSYLSANVVFDDFGVKSGTMGISRDVTKQKRNTEHFQHIVDNATDIIYTTNINGDITYVNTSANSVLGYSNEDFIGMPFSHLVHPDFADEVVDHYSKQFAERSKETYLEFKIIKATGESIWIGQNVRTTFSPTDPTLITGFFGILRNLDEIKKVEIELLESESKYRELFDNSKDLIQSVAADGAILYVNDAWKTALGYSSEEIKNLNLFDIIHKESRDYCEGLLSNILANGSDKDFGEHTLRMVTKDGREVVLKGRVTVKYEQGEVKSLQTFFRDVTDHDKVEQELVKSQENFRLIGNSINDVFFLYNTIYENYDYISPNCEAVLGVAPEFFLSQEKYTDKYIHPDDRKLVESLNQTVREGSTGQVEYRRRVSDGEMRWIDEKWFPIKDENDRIVSISGVCRDVTDVKGAYDIIYEQNKEISQSILYAKNIQESTLPSGEEITNILPESFVFYKAKDILSGDLYIVEQVKGNNGELWPAFVVGDCTGHGVPGGLLSLLCSGLLRESITNAGINSPAEALDFVREKLIRLFRSNPSKYILDGMDAAFCVLNQSENELYFSGANLSCYIVRGEEVLEYRGDKQHIGYSTRMAPFVPFTIDVEKDDIIYLTTDGYVDQFGGEKNKKFLRKRFTELLLEIKDLPMFYQKKKIREKFLSWKGETEQTDDIAVIGVRI